MIYIELFLGFLIVGCFSFGGAYGAIPLIKDVVMSYGWVSEEMFTYFVAVSESTPGPIMVNLATYVGSSRGGFFGALLATTAVVIPAFLLILLVVTVMKKVLDNPYVRACMKGIEPCVIGIIFATGISMIVKNMVPAATMQEINVDVTAVAITMILIVISTIGKKRSKKPVTPIQMILLAAVFGMLLY